MAVIGQRYYSPNPFEVDATGVPYASARLYFYVSGTSTLADTYADVTLSTPNTNPVVADANGRFGTIFLSPQIAYKIELWTPSTVDDPVGSQIWSEDPCGPGAGGVPTNVAGIIGEVRAFAGISASIPAGWYQCYGQAVSRTTYSEAFAALGTTWGAGDGSTTFNLPDLRGRGLFGLDNMGGLAANRITSGVSGISGTGLGSVGGNQATQTHTHTVNDPTHNHTLTDPTHSHAQTYPVTLGTGLFVGGSRGDAPYATDASILTSSNSTGITLAAASTGITNQTYGAGSSQNMPPTAIVYWIIYLGA